MNEKNKKHEAEIQDATNNKPTKENKINSEPMTEEEFSEDYQKLPMWQHVILVILFLFGLAAIIISIDFVVDFFTEMLKRIF